MLQFKAGEHPATVMNRIAMATLMRKLNYDLPIWIINQQANN